MDALIQYFLILNPTTYLIINMIKFYEGLLLSFLRSTGDRFFSPFSNRKSKKSIYSHFSYQLLKREQGLGKNLTIGY